MRFPQLVALWIAGVGSAVLAATVQERYYAHQAVHDAHGVIAPWYTGPNGQIDERIRVAVETLKRYPWTPEGKAPRRLPEFIYSGSWHIDAEGQITIPDIHDWANGDLAQRAAYILGSLIDYYRYSGDPWAKAVVAMQADALLDFALTPDDHDWPRFLISVPVRGKPYGQADPRGMIQLDIAAEVGIFMVRAAQLCGNDRYLEAARHWADLLAARRLREAGVNPWPRYANPQQAPWEDIATGGVAFILEFFDELIRSGYTGENGALVEARADGIAYLRDVLLPNWLEHDAWGRNYWDWPCPVQVENVTEFACRYMMDHPDEFPNWHIDVRNILTLFINRTCVSASNGDTFSGAWAYPESSGCCGRSLWYGPLELAPVYAQYAAILSGRNATGTWDRAGDGANMVAWAREMARRQMILATYDFLPTGVVEDGIDGGPVVAGDWFKIAHPMALKHCLNAIAWMPEVFAPAHEAHIVRSTDVIVNVTYGADHVTFCTHDSGRPSTTLLRVGFKPTRVGKFTTDFRKVTSLHEMEWLELPKKTNRQSEGYALTELPNGDFLVEVCWKSGQEISIAAENIADLVAPSADDAWGRSGGEPPLSLVTDKAGATATYTFEGTQVTLIGGFCPLGGQAEVFLDGVKQHLLIDCWAPVSADGPLFRRTGLHDGPHTLKVVSKGSGNPASAGTRVVLYGFSSGKRAHEDALLADVTAGPTGPQRWIFGYPHREDYVDSAGNCWRPATEWVARAGDQVDSVTAAWVTRRRQLVIEGTKDPELYRYGVQFPEFWANFTVGPGNYQVRLLFAEHRWSVGPEKRATSILINGKQVVSGMDIAATAARAAGIAATRPEQVSSWLSRSHGLNRAVDIVFENVRPQNGIVSIRFRGVDGSSPMVQAVELTPFMSAGAPVDECRLARHSAIPVTVRAPAAAAPSKETDGNLLVNGSFEEGGPKDLGALGKTGSAAGWNYTLASAGQAYIWIESDYIAHPDWGLPEYHHGNQAVRTHADRGGHTLLWQDVLVVPRRTYTASAWVRTADLKGEGFGTDPCDRAGLILQEIDVQGQLVHEHPKQAVSEAGDYRELKLTFETRPSTARVRFILEAIQAQRYDQGHVTFDACSLIAAVSE